MSGHTAEVERGERFRFGENWRRFLTSLDKERIVRAEESLRQFLALESLEGLRFLDAGSGSGLFSLAANRLGAVVHSFDFDPHSVACTAELKERYRGNDRNWEVERGSVLDTGYLAALGEFEIVYSWGVLHHTGRMWQALDNLTARVATRGRLYIAIYNDQGPASRRWARVKRAYNRLPRGLKFLVLWPAFLRLWGPTSLRDLLRGRPFRTWRDYAAERGMSPWHNVVDWVGGYPFEVAKPEEILSSCRRRGFELLKMKTCDGGHGCNEFLLRKSYPSGDSTNAPQ